MSSTTRSGKGAPRAPSRSVVLKGQLGRFSQVPDALLEDQSLSHTARLVLSWVAGRPAKWTICVDGAKGIKAALSLSRSQWARVMVELRDAGIYTASSISRGRASVGWTLTFNLSRYYS